MSHAAGPHPHTLTRISMRHANFIWLRGSPLSRLKVGFHLVGASHICAAESQISASGESLVRLLKSSSNMALNCKKAREGGKNILNLFYLFRFSSGWFGVRPSDGRFDLPRLRRFSRRHRSEKYGSHLYVPLHLSESLRLSWHHCAPE